jgi:superfamily II DNA or RNA helicase
MPTRKTASEKKETKSGTNKKPKARQTSAKSKKEKVKKVSYHKRPFDMPMEEWQKALRVQFGKESEFTMTNTGEHPVFSDFILSNPESKAQYKIAIRSNSKTGHFCSCMDFKTNRLGTCKHLAFALHKRGFKKFFRQGHEQSHSSIYLDYQDGRKIKMSIGSDSRKEYEKLASKYFDVNGLVPSKVGLLTTKGFSDFEKVLEEGRHIHPSFRCYDDALEFVLEQREHLERNKKLDKLFPQQILPKDIKGLVHLKLYDYQEKGVAFALKAGRCLIADDMGLGKTIQAITAAELYKKHFKISRVVIVCPTSLKYQWQSEIEKFTGSKAHVIEGNILKRREQYENNEAFYHIIGYLMAANDVADINRMEPDLLIIDEAQRLKNWKTKTSAAIKKIRSTYSIVLTGTPIENKLEELYSIMQVIDQYRLGPMYAFLFRHQIADEDSGKLIGYHHLKEIGINLSDVMLRRTKKQVLLEMPKRMDKVLLVPMTETQRQMHDEFADGVARLVHKWNRFGFLNEKDRLRLMLLMSQMRMVCDSSYILDLKTRHDTKIDELMCILEEFFCNEEEKVVIFSQWSRMLDLVKAELEERDMPFQYLHGNVPSKERQYLLQTFRDDPACRVFLSTDAGGVGLNLQMASLVINLDVPWNPAVLEQRIARVYRLGQKRPVQVINLVSAATIEHRMLDVLKFKNAMAQGVLDDGDDAIFMSESKFKDFMGKIEDLTNNNATTSDPGFEKTEELKEEQLQMEQAPTNEEAMMEEAAIASFAEEEQSVAGETAPRAHTTGKIAPGALSSPESLVQTGMSFFQGLVKTLQDPKATKELVNQIVEKEEKTGKTYLKIPLENEEVIGQALQMLGALFGSRPT